MKSIFPIIFTALALTTAFASPASAEEADDILYGNVGMGLAHFSGGPADSAFAVAHRAGLGVRLSPNMAIETSLSSAADPLTTGVSTIGIGAGVNYRVSRHLELVGGLRYRRSEKTDSAITGAFGNIVEGLVKAAGECEGADCQVVEHDGNQTVDDLGIEVAVASQWQWSWFTLGVEWVSAHQAIVTFGSENDLDDVSLETRLMTVHLGASF